MDQRLAVAAREGDVDDLLRILKEDPQMLEKASLANFRESPLHVAALAGKADFVKQIVTLMPSLATEPNQNSLIPLHMASAQGHVTTVKELLKAKLDEVNQCLLKDDDGWTPLHYAARKGRVGVIEELINHSPECLEEVTAKRETVLHLAVKANQFGALQVLEDNIKLHNFHTLFLAKDNNGKNFRELAKNKKVLEVLKENEKGEIREQNCMMADAEGKDTEVFEKKENKASKEPAAETDNNEMQFQNMVLLVGTLILTLTYQGLLNPPPTLFKKGIEIDWGYLVGRSGQNERSGMFNFMKNCPALLAFMFLVMNTLIYLTSISVVAATLRGRRSLTLRLLFGFLTICYCILLLAFSRYTAYVALPLAFASILFQYEDIAREDFLKPTLSEAISQHLLHRLKEISSVFVRHSKPLILKETELKHRLPDC